MRCNVAEDFGDETFSFGDAMRVTMDEATGNE